ncbi:hypothetical protein ACFYTF_30965 [Nocardia thailandica]|uniref:Uncharacterized protein n=1 Tax=Nocardia thailandica TaxID=257275 RepID=A0ABW6PY81_9NOCA
MSEIENRSAGTEAADLQPSPTAPLRRYQRLRQGVHQTFTTLIFPAGVWLACGALQELGSQIMTLIC